MKKARPDKNFEENKTGAQMLSNKLALVPETQLLSTSNLLPSQVLMWPQGNRARKISSEAVQTPKGGSESKATDLAHYKKTK